MPDFSDKSAEELRDMAEWFGEQNWEENKEACHEELRNRSEPVNPEEDEDVIGESEEELREKLELFREKGWTSNVERIEEELTRQENMDSSEELDEEDDLTHAEHLSEDNTVEMQVAKFYSTGEDYRDFDDMPEAERQALEEEGISLP